MRILYVIHDFLPRHAAGSQVYAHDLAREIASEGHAVRFFTSESRPGEKGPFAMRERQVGGLGVAEVAQRRSIHRLSDSFFCQEIEERFAQEVRAFAPDVVHYHHLLHLSLRLPAQVPPGVRQVFTLHDYWLTCPRGGQRLDWRGRICEQVDPDKCARCLAGFHADVSLPGRLAERAEAAAAGLFPPWIWGGPLRNAVRWGLSRAAGPLGLPPKYDPAACRVDLEERRQAVGALVDLVDRFIAPSAFLAARLEEAGLPAEKICVSDYGFDALGPARAPRPAGQELRVGYVGTLVPHKGIHHLIEALGRLKGLAVRLELHGDPAAFASYSQILGRLSRGLPVRFAGPFAPAERARIYAGLDVLVLPSVWWENSPLTLHEAQLAGLPLLAPRLGAMEGLVRHEQNGLLYEPGSPASLADQLRRLCTEGGLRERLVQGAGGAGGVKALADDADWTLALYRQVLEAAA